MRPNTKTPMIHHRSSSVSAFVYFALTLGVFVWLAGCQPHASSPETEALISDSTRIVSVNSATTEILCKLGYSQNIVGLDITSTYPDSIQHLPKVGYNRNVSVEGILSLSPDMVIGVTNGMKPEHEALLTQSGVRLLLFDQELSQKGTEALIRSMGDTLGKAEEGVRMISQIEDNLGCLETEADSPTVLFVYARGAGSMSVAGRGTQVQEVITMAGGKNPAFDFEGFKPLSSEILVEANPEIILMFESGLESLSGPRGLEDLPGMSDTHAGKNRRFVTMDGVLLTGFGPRLGLAVCELAEKIHQTGEEIAYE